MIEKSGRGIGDIDFSAVAAEPGCIAGFGAAAGFGEEFNGFGL